MGPSCRTRGGDRQREEKREAAGKVGKEGGGEGEATPLSCAPPLPSQKLLTHEGGGAGDGGSVRAG